MKKIYAALVALLVLVMALVAPTPAIAQTTTSSGCNIPEALIGGNFQMPGFTPAQLAEINEVMGNAAYLGDLSAYPKDVQNENTARLEGLYNLLHCYQQRDEEKDARIRELEAQLAGRDTALAVVAGAAIVLDGSLDACVAELLDCEEKVEAYADTLADEREDNAALRDTLDDLRSTSQSFGVQLGMFDDIASFTYSKERRGYRLDAFVRYDATDLSNENWYIGGSYAFSLTDWFMVGPSARFGLNIRNKNQRIFPFGLERDPIVIEGIDEYNPYLGVGVMTHFQFGKGWHAEVNPVYDLLDQRFWVYSAALKGIYFKGTERFLMGVRSTNIYENPAFDFRIVF